MSTGALIKACNKAATLANTGSECDESLGPVAMLFAVPPGLTWTAEDMEDFTSWLNTQLHAPVGQRIYPLFGPGIPIRKITTNKESDVISVQEDGTPIFIRYGTLTRDLATTEGGLCYAQALQTFNKAGYTIIEVDNANLVLFRNNGDGTFGGLKTTFMYSPSPDLADFKNPGYIHFQVTYFPQEYIGFGTIYQGDDSLIELVGLLDAQVTAGATPSTTTDIYVAVSTICGGTDLVALLGSALAEVSNFVVTNASGTVETVTAAAVVSDQIQLTGTWTASDIYTIALAAASQLLTNNIDGYEGTESVSITIP